MRNALHNLLLTFTTGLALLLAGPLSAGTWIVEFDQPPAAHWLADQGLTVYQADEAALQDYRQQLADAQDTFLAALGHQGIPAQLSGAWITDTDGFDYWIDYRYTLVFNGLSLDMDAEWVDQVGAMDGVRAVHRNEVLYPVMDASVEYIFAHELYGSQPALGPWDELSDGLEGQGVLVSIIDTGIEWSHEMFGGDPTPPRFGLNPHVAAVGTNEKVIYQLPLFGGVIDDHGHGTHVGATTSGYLGFARENLAGEEIPIHGVAPQSRLMAYKVCSGAGNCLGNQIIMAIEDSASPRTINGHPKPVAHVINMSLGGTGGPDSPNAVAADNAALAGVIVVSSAGNSGPGKRTIGQPSAGRHVISVGANNDPTPGASSVEVLPDDQFDFLFLADFAADSNAGLPMEEPLTGHYVFAGFADTPDQVPLEVLGNICLVERGSTAEAAGQGTGLFANKVLNCEARGAIATVIFNNEPGRPGPVLAPGTRPVYTISQEAGLVLRDDLGFNPLGVSNFPIRLNLPDPDLFTPMMAGFSSRGPVAGMGQIKPDVTAPGVAILSATTPVGAPVLSMQSETRYIRASGTSMSGPHVAGAAALIRQARPDWTPDHVRTALINTATNLRDLDDLPKPDGLEADDVLSQGGGLIDVAAAATTPALMGVTGPGLANTDAPALLGSHSFGPVPVVNSRAVHVESVEVSLIDVANQDGSWSLSVVNNRDLQFDGLDVELSADQVSVAAGGSAEFTVSLVADGDVLDFPLPEPIRDSRTGQLLEQYDTQWYVIATNDDDATIRMPFHLRPTASQPAGEIPTAPELAIEADFIREDGTRVNFDGDVTLSWNGNPEARGYIVERPINGGRIEEVFVDILPAGDLNLQLEAGVTYIDIPFQVGADVVGVQGDLHFEDLVNEVDLFLLDPEGAVYASSLEPGGPEHISAIVDRPGTWRWRVSGYVSAAAEFELTSVQELRGEPIVEVDGDTTSVVLEDQPQGVNAYQVRMITAGKIGDFEGLPSNVKDILVDRREFVEITDVVSTMISNVELSNNVFSFDLNLTNNDSEDYLPLVEFNIIGIDSASGTVEAINADNGGAGTSSDDPALYDYSHMLGDDYTLVAGETTGARRLEFSNTHSELFTFDALVSGYRRQAEDVNNRPEFAGKGADAHRRQDGERRPDRPTEDEGEAGIMRFEVNPLTGNVTVTLIDLLDDLTGAL